MRACPGKSAALLACFGGCFGVSALTAFTCDMWPWTGSSSQTLSEDQLKQLQRKSRAIRQAWVACVKSNKHLEEAQIEQACRGLEVSLLQSYAGHQFTCPTEAERFRECITRVALNESLQYSACDPQLERMQKCLRKFRQLVPLTQ